MALVAPHILTEEERAALFRAREIAAAAERRSREAQLHGDPAAAARIRRNFAPLIPDRSGPDADDPQAR